MTFVTTYACLDGYNEGRFRFVYLDAVSVVLSIIAAKAAAVELLQQRDEALVLPDLLIAALCRNPAVLQVNHLCVHTTRVGELSVALQLMIRLFDRNTAALAAGASRTTCIPAAGA